MILKDEIISILQVLESDTGNGNAVHESQYHKVAEDIVRFLNTNVNTQFVPVFQLIRWCNSGYDVYEEDGEIQNKFYNTAVEDLRFWTNKNYGEP